MSRRARSALALVALAGLAALAAWAVTGLPDVGDPPGPNAERVPLVVAKERSVANVVNGVTYDLRATDTLGEELILFVAALGVAALLRSARERDRRATPEDGGADAEHDDDDAPAAAGRSGDRDAGDRPAASSALRAAGAVLVGPVIVLGIYVVTHGQLTPGGGFQGGVVLAAAVLLVFSAGQVLALERMHPTSFVEVSEATGALAFALVGLAGIVFSGALLANVIGLAPMGSLLSGGTVPVLSLATGVEVTGAFTLIFMELLDQTLLQGPA